MEDQPQDSHADSGPQPAATPDPGRQYPAPGAPYPQQPRPPYPGQPPYAAPGAYPPPAAYRPQKPISGKAVTSLIIGGAMLLFFPLGIIGNIVGGVLGFVALKETREPEGTRRGRGFAIGGICTNIGVWLITAGICALIGFAIYMGVQEQRARSQRWKQEQAAEQKRDADADLQLIAERLQLYFTENDHSLGPGGPVVTDGGSGGLYPPDHPKVKGTLKLSDLVIRSQLHDSLYAFKLTITGDTTARITYLTTGRTLIVDDVAKNTTHFKGS